MWFPSPTRTIWTRNNMPTPIRKYRMGLVRYELGGAHSQQPGSRCTYSSRHPTYRRGTATGDQHGLLRHVSMRWRPAMRTASSESLTIQHRATHGTASIGDWNTESPETQLQQDQQLFSPDTRRFGDTFGRLQEVRQRADYDHAETFTTNLANTWIDRAEEAIRGFMQASIEERTAIAVQSLIRRRRN